MQLRFDRIIEDKQVPAVIKALAQRIQVGGYLTVGMWLESISDADLELLLLITERLMKEGDDVHPKLAAAMLSLSIMLAFAEGITPADNDEEAITEIQKWADMCGQFLVVESLYRKGIVEFFRDKASFGMDTLNDTIAQIKDFGGLQ